MEIVKMLLEAGSKVNVKDNRGNLPLHHAAMKGHTAIIDILMENGSEINVQDKNGWSPLHCAAYWCHLEAAEALIAHGADISLLNKDERSALHETCRSPEDDESKLGKIANLFIAKGSDVNAKSSDEGEADFTPLMFAAYHGHPCVAQALINADCEIQAYGTNGWTALHWATDRDQKEVVYLLLEAGCDPTVKGERGELASERTKDKELKSALRNAEKMFKELSILDEADKALKKSQNANGSAAVPIGNSHQTGAMISPTESDKVLLSVSSVSSRSAPLVEEEPTGVSDNEDDDYINCSKKEEIFNNCQINDISHGDYEKNSESNATDLTSDKLSLNEGEIR
ncbi:ankyrin repeat domain-containing protein 6-like [Octopus vulgaris]|uniref:Ankyrin repeat domain-containing protein 6-like n=1 Tax=Octopus vulgaris TaxID=6645 RepID=A0AA36BSR3_OCTVU|nr:ankyrin repeat domain-containing protein 6-like [Octopus vulgaris]